ncbi:MAG TPA: SpoIID/LytB domain-containing protein [Bacillota bacterium]|nr:SpoIID/LytB domain-containing protein [Bacillota bacterium]
MLRKITWTLVGFLVLVMVVTVGCQRRQEQKPIPRATKLGNEPQISLFINETGQKKVIGIEEYLTGVVAAEMDTGWPLEALAAQAILARTFTMENIKQGRVKKLHGTDASTSVEEFQAYAPKKVNARVKKAVAMTRGEVVLYRDKYIHAWYSACDGGKSATAREGLAFNKQPTPYLKVVEDGCMKVTTPENQRWTARFTAEQVRQAVLKSTGQNTGSINSVSITKKGPSGRAETIKVGNAEVSGPALRLALGSDTVRSMKLDSLYHQGGTVYFQGKGFGHGVGMCQWGANKLAKSGKSPEDIIRFYFKNIDIKKQWK